MQRCAADDKLDMVSASVHVLALLCGGVCPVARWHSFFYEGRIPPGWRSHSRFGSGGGGAYPPPFPVCSAVAGGDPVREAIHTAALTGSHVLVLADAWSGMIVFR